jgi:hypothetical protein
VAVTLRYPFEPLSASLSWQSTTRSSRWARKASCVQYPVRLGRLEGALVTVTVKPPLPGKETNNVAGLLHGTKIASA